MTKNKEQTRCHCEAWLGSDTQRCLHPHVALFTDPFLGPKLCQTLFWVHWWLCLPKHLRLHWLLKYFWQKDLATCFWRWGQNSVGRTPEFGNAWDRKQVRISNTYQKKRAAHALQTQMINLYAGLSSRPDPQREKYPQRTRELKSVWSKGLLRGWKRGLSIKGIYCLYSRHITAYNHLWLQL